MSCKKAEVRPVCRRRGMPTRVSGGPFHYQIRASPYGELYDEIPWKVAFGIAEPKGRDPTDRSSAVCAYNPTQVLVHNWFENTRDRETIKFRRPPPLSRFSWFYKTTYVNSYNKRECEKERLTLQKIPGFPIGVFPGHQRELNVDMLANCIPRPSLCIHHDQKEHYEKYIAKQMRLEREKPSQPQQPYYEICQN